jgi:hypothetical protein
MIQGGSHEFFAWTPGGYYPDGEYYFLPIDFRYRDQASIAEQGITRRRWIG